MKVLRITLTMKTILRSANKALDDINKFIQEKIDELNEKFDSKADLESTLNDIKSLKESIKEINSKKQVDPNSHAANSKKIEDLQDRMEAVEDFEQKLNELNTKDEELAKLIKSNEQFLDKLVKSMDEKASERDVSNLVSQVNSTSANFSKLTNHLNEIQKQIDSIKSESGPNFLQMINSLEKHLESVQEAFNQRMYDTEKSAIRLEEEVTEFKAMADKTDISVIKLVQKVDTMQIKLDLLDQAFNGFMVPAGLLHGSQDSSNIDFLKDSLASLRREYFKFKDEAGANFALIGETLSKNADKHDLKDLENKVNDKLENNEKSILKTKSEFRRIIKDLEDKVTLANLFLAQTRRCRLHFKRQQL